MTWRQLKKYIDSQKKDFLDEPVKLFDFETREEHIADVTELHNGDDGWVPYISINSEVYNGEVKEASVD